MYGMTELPGTIAAITFDAKYGMGSVCPNISIKIVNPETNEPCEANEVGEILVKSPVTMKGNLNRPDANAKFFGKDGIWIMFLKAANFS